MSKMSPSFADGAVCSPQIAGEKVDRPPTPKVSHEEVLHMGKEKAEVMKRLVQTIIALIEEEGRK